MDNLYETVLITVPEIPDKDLKTIKSKVETPISKVKGKIIKNDDWGVKKLTYFIKHNKRGKYLYYQYSAEPVVIRDIERALRIDERVLRFLTTKVEPEKQETKKEKKS